MNYSNLAYKNLLRGILANGSSAEPRGQGTLEVIANTTVIDMAEPIITTPDRELDYQFMAAEALWILSGEGTLNHPLLKKNLKKYSDDGHNMSGAYGPPFIDQVEYCIKKLCEDPMSRQCVMTLWRQNPRPSKDIPCTVSLQFLLRNGKIHTIVNMRSSDAWLGFPYDVFCFTMMTLYVSLALPVKHELGHLHVIAGSQHLYQRNQEAAKLIKHYGDNIVIDTHKFNTPDDLLIALDCDRNEPDCTKWRIVS